MKGKRKEGQDLALARPVEPVDREQMFSAVRFLSASLASALTVVDLVVDLLATLALAAAGRRAGDGRALSGRRADRFLEVAARRNAAEELEAVLHRKVDESRSEQGLGSFGLGLGLGRRDVLRQSLEGRRGGGDCA